MSSVSVATLKTYFNTGDKPTEANFIDVFDSMLNLADGGTVAGATTFSAGTNLGIKLLAAGASQTVSAADSGKTIVFDVAAATLCTLPAPALGMQFDFVTSILATGDHEVQAATNAEGFVGGVSVVSTTAAKADFFSAADAGTDDFITQTGGTNGGGPGSHLRIVGRLASSAAKCWLVSGVLGAVGSTVVTPFAAS